MKKEYLVKTIEDTYVYFDRKPETGMTYIEIPEGADMYLTGCKSIPESNNWFAKKVNNIIHSYSESEWNQETIERLPNQNYDLLWSRHTQPEELPFVDDEPKVDETLQERQSQYGEFKEVASTTQYLLQMLSNDKMSDVQLESLHMICSKLSRIAHGDPNHIDSWHDIAGYATLVVKDIS